MTVFESAPKLTNIQGIIQKYKRLNFDKYLPKWKLYINSYIGGDDYTLADGYLIKHSFEDDNEFRIIKEKAFYSNYCKLIINKFAKNIYRDPPIRKGDELLRAAFSYVSYGGKLTNEPDIFYQNLFKMLCCMGEMFLFTDHPPGDFKQENDLEKQALGIKYIEEMIFPQTVIVNSPMINPEITVLKLNNNYYKLWTPEEYIIFEGNRVIEREKHDFGYIPINRIAIDENLDEFGESLIRDIAKINNAIFNLRNRNWYPKIQDSNQTVLLPMDNKLLVMKNAMDRENPDTGKSDNNLKKVEFYTPGAEPKILQRDSSVYQDNREEIKELIEEIRVLSNQRSEVTLNTSGVSKMYDQQNFANSLEMFAVIMEVIELEEANRKFELIGATKPPEFALEYHKNYYIKDEKLTIEDYRLIANDPTMPPTARKIARYQICLECLPLSKQDEATIEAELDEMAKKPEPVEQSADNNKDFSESELDEVSQEEALINGNV